MARFNEKKCELVRHALTTVFEPAGVPFSTQEVFEHLMTDDPEAWKYVSADTVKGYVKYVLRGVFTENVGQVSHWSFYEFCYVGPTKIRTIPRPDKDGKLFVHDSLVRVLHKSVGRNVFSHADATSALLRETRLSPSTSARYASRVLRSASDKSFRVGGSDYKARRVRKTKSTKSGWEFYSVDARS